MSLLGINREGKYETANWNALAAANSTVETIREIIARKLN